MRKLLKPGSTSATRRGTGIRRWQTSSSASATDSHRQSRADDADVPGRHEVRAATGKQRGTILFVGTKRQARDIVARRRNAPECPRRSPLAGWHAHHFKTVKASIKPEGSRADATDGTFERMSKRAGSVANARARQARKSLGGIKDMTALPTRCRRRRRLSQDRRHRSEELSIPIIGVVDTNHSPDGISYVDTRQRRSSRAIRLYGRGVADAVQEARAP